MGRIFFALDEDGRAALRSRLLGFVFQSFQLLPALNALENVMLPLELAGDARASGLAREMLARVGLAERLRPLPEDPFGGRAAARGARPRLRHAAEAAARRRATGNLDAATGAGVIDLIVRVERAGAHHAAAGHP